MIATEIYDRIIYYTDLFDKDSDIVSLIENDETNIDGVLPKWINWGPSDQKIIYGQQKRIDDKTLYKNNIIKNIYDSIIKCSKEYSNRYGVDIGNLTPLSISKYFEGQSMGSHIDSYSDTPKEVLSIVLYLNDNYKGGELYFKNQNIKIKPQSGSLIAFPSVDPYFHESLPVSSGIKYISPGFWIKN